MKRKSLFSLVTSLTVLGIISLTKTPSATAAPAPIFRPILSSILASLPAGLPLRLPTFIPSVNRNLYPIIQTDSNSSTSFSVMLGSEPNCIGHYCQIGQFEVSKDASLSEILEFLRDNDQPLARINLRRGVRGYYTIKTTGTGSGEQSVFWQENGIYFNVSLRDPAISKQEVLDVAISMANEPLLRSQQEQVAQSVRTTTRPRLLTWNQFIRSDETEISSDFDIPQQFKNGYVYRVQGASNVNLYIFKAGLPAYPVPINDALVQISGDVAEPYIRRGQAIILFFNMGYSGVQYMNDTRVRFPERGEGCFKTICLTAPTMTNAQISRILRSQRQIRR